MLVEVIRGLHFSSFNSFATATATNPHCRRVLRMWMFLLNSEDNDAPKCNIRKGAIHLWRPQKSDFWLPSLSTWAGPPPLVDIHTRSTWNTHRSLEMASSI